jgi:hypothetical protein
MAIRSSPEMAFICICLACSAIPARWCDTHLRPPGQAFLWTPRSGFPLVMTPSTSNEPCLLVRGMQRLRMRMVCAQCEEPSGQRPHPAAPPSRRASGRRSRPLCQSFCRPSRARGPTSLPLKRLARPLWLLNLTKFWQSPANELSQ